MNEYSNGRLHQFIQDGKCNSFSFFQLHLNGKCTSFFWCAIPFNSRWMVFNASLTHRFCQNMLMACLHQFKQFFLWIGLHCLPLKCYCLYRMNAPVYRCAITYNSRWTASNASKRGNFWQITLMTCCHQFQTVFSISKTALAFFEVLLLLQGKFTSFKACNYIKFKMDIF